MDKQQLLHEIDSIKSQFNNLPTLNDGEIKRLREDFMVEFTYNSNAIEGSSLTLYETRLVVLEGLVIVKKPLKEHMEAVGHKDAFEYIISKSKNNEPLSERTIKEIHSLVLINDAANKGMYRELPVIISGALDTPPNPA